MIVLRKDAGDDYNIFIMSDGVEVGRISHDNLIPDSLYDNLETDKEIKMVEEIEKPSDFMHLNFITIYDDYRGTGLFYEAMRKFEVYSTMSGFTSITLFTSPELLPIYKKLGYQEMFYLDSVKHYLLKKEVINHVRKE